MREDVAVEDDAHVVVCGLEGVIASAEEDEDGIEEDEADDGEGDAHDEVEDDEIAEDAASFFVVFFAKRDGADDARADADEGSEGRSEVHEWGGEPDA